MPKSRNKRVSKRGNHRERVKSHDEFLMSKFPDQFNLTSPFSAPIAELLDGAVMETLTENNSPEEWRKEWEEKIAGMKKSGTLECPLVENTEEAFIPTEVPVIEGELIEDREATPEEIKEAFQQLLHNGTIGK